MIIELIVMDYMYLKYTKCFLSSKLEAFCVYVSDDTTYKQYFVKLFIFLTPFTLKIITGKC